MKSHFCNSTLGAICDILREDFELPTTFFPEEEVTKKMLYPVVHCLECDMRKTHHHATGNVDVALKNGADGVFLACSNPLHLVNTYLHVRNDFPSAWIGLRFQRVCPNMEHVRLVGVARSSVGLNALWVDKLPGTRLDVSMPVFGSLSLNYSKAPGEEEEFRNTCRRAVQVADVATVFGPAVDAAPGMAMVSAVRSCVGSDMPLAIAGGISAENLFKFVRSTDIFIVSSSISEGGNLVASKVSELAERIHG